MKQLRSFSKKYYLRQIVACWMVCSMLLSLTPVRIAMATTTPGSDAVPGSGNLTSAVGAGITNEAANLLEITQTQPEAIMRWNNFDVGQNSTVNIIQPGATAALLNRVSDATGTGIWGTINANGRVFIINPAGVVFGPTATINVAQLVASSLDIADEDAFLNGEPLEFIGGDGAVINQGSINADSVTLIGKMVENSGTITTPSGGFVAMVAGDRVLLGEPGGKIVVEVDAVASADTISVPGIGDVTAGDVINTETGVIDSPDGRIVLAAGDLFSVPLHPQLQVGEVENRDYDYTDPADKAVIDLQPIRVETGIGSVQQLGTIHADGTEGSVVLTAGDDVVLGDGSLTSSVGGEVINYAYDFSNKSATTYFNDGATIQVGDGLADISGNHILLNGYVDALPGATIQVDPVTLTIADGGIPPGGAALDTVYEQWVELYSNAAVNLDLAADDLITVEYMTDGEILGGSGDILLRNIFDDGGIYFEDVGGLRTTIHTTAGFENGYGGDIFMIAGAGGIVAGDLIADTLSSDKISDPGRIRLLTTNGGDIEVGAMSVSRGGFTEISAIASGNLTVNGDVKSINTTVPKNEKEVGQARICLIAGEDYDAEDQGWEPKDIVFNGGEISVEAHGKYDTTADIRISATGNVTIGSADNTVKISAQAKTSEQPDATGATAYTVIHAGRTNPVAGVITINGETYTSGSGYLTSGDIIAKAWPGSLSIDTDGAPTSSSGTESIWEDTGTPAEDFFVRIEINNQEATPLSNPDSPCYDCPKPEGLPPVPAIFWIVDDTFETNWRAGNIFGFDPAELDVLDNDNGIKFDAEIIIGSLTTTKGGTLELVLFDPGPNEYYGFRYTPPTDQPFEWDGVSEYASFQDTFEYQATKEVDGQIIYSRNTATVTIDVRNILPVAYGDSKTEHMDTNVDFDLTPYVGDPLSAPAGTLVIDADGTPGTLTMDKGSNDAVFGVASVAGVTATYDPFDGFVGNDDFDYTVTDSAIDYQGNPVTSATLSVTMQNDLPGGAVVLNDAPMNANHETLGVASGDFTDADDPFSIVGITPATGDDNKTFGGTLAYNGSSNPYVSGDTYDYTADPLLPGYVGEDDFDVELWDGQYDYIQSGTPVAGYEHYQDDIYRKPVYGTGTIDLTVTNTLPSGAVVLDYAHMDDSTPVAQELGVASGDFTDDGPFAIVNITPATDDDNFNYGGSVSYNGSSDPYVSGDTYDYTADPLLPGYVGEDDFDVELWDGQTNYTFVEVEEGVWQVGSATPVYGSGTIDVELTNTLPTAFGDLGTTPQGIVLVVPQTGTTSPVQVLDNDVPPYDDPLSIVPGTYSGSAGGTLEFVCGEWVYTPAGGHTGPEEFNIDVWDGQYDYTFGDGYERAAVYGCGRVIVDVYELPPPPPPPPPALLAPVAPLPQLEIPRVEGCPVLTTAVATELGITGETLQVGLGDALALNPNVQPCQACASLLDASVVLQNQELMAAMAQTFNTLAPADAPYTPEMATSIAMAFENATEGSQYASAAEFIDAFIEYAAALDQLGSPTGDSTTYVMDKYGAGLSENPNMASYVAERIASGQPL